jgi:hypothetical protein
LLLFVLNVLGNLLQKFHNVRHLLGFFKPHCCWNVFHLKIYHWRGDNYTSVFTILSHFLSLFDSGIVFPYFFGLCHSTFEDVRFT